MQGCSLQNLTCFIPLGHAAPLFEGGVTRSRVRCVKPDSHVFEHGVHEFHCVTAQSTGQPCRLHVVVCVAPGHWLMSTPPLGPRPLAP